VNTAGGQTLAEKIVQMHMTRGPRRRVRAGDVVGLRPRHVLSHDNTAAVIEKFRAIGVGRVHDSTQPVFVLDHDVQNRSEDNQRRYATIEAFARDHGVDFHPAGAGIGHQIMVSRGYVVPGSLCVASDSHATTYGALGALGTPIVRTDAAAVWSTGEFWWQVPRTLQVELHGGLVPGVVGKDLILALCGMFAGGEAQNAIVEFTGEGVSSLGMDSRLSIANMTTEWGAVAGVFPVDDVTVDHMRRVRNALAARDEQRFCEADLMRWSTDPPAADPDAVYAGRIEFDLSSLRPVVAGPDSVRALATLAEVGARHTKIDKAYLLSCVNGRLEDLQAAARVLRGRHVHDGVSFYVAAASADVQAAAEADGTWQTLLDAGAHALPPGCGPCIGLGEGSLEPGEVAISATNRNFPGRMGSRDACAYLASPAVVAASALEGEITAPPGVPAAGPVATGRFEPGVRTDPDPDSDRSVEIVEGFPERIEGRAIVVPADDLDTDGIYGKDHVYRDLSAEEMARVVLENHDPDFASVVREGDVLVVGFGFGSGSSREQAATALAAAGIRLVVAGSYAQTFLRNAYNNGLPCITCPAFVESIRSVLFVPDRRTVVAPATVTVDFVAGVVRYDGREHPFPPMGELPQSLVAAGGIESMIRRELRP
jgi:homoaconitate hydratase